jgi:hypothetical protein
LIAHAADHIKRIPRFSAQGKLQGVFLNALCQGIFQGRVDLEKPVSRTQPADALVGPSVIVQLPDTMPIRPNIGKSVTRGIHSMMKQ